MLQRQETAFDGRHLKETLQENVSTRISVKTALTGPEGKIRDIALFQACPLPLDHRQICRLFLKMPVQIGQDAFPRFRRRASAFARYFL